MTHKHHDDDAVIYVERESTSILPLFLLGAAVGAGLALLLSPGTGEENRRGLTRRMRSLLALAEEKVDELGESFGRGRRTASNGSEPDEDDDDEERAAPHSLSAREELERRLEEALARRRDFTQGTD
jgi:hypothetical protein